MIFSPRLELGGNYTHTQLENISNPATKLTDVSEHKLTAHALLAVYRPAKNITTEVGVNNLADKNYFLADGFPNLGRTVFANATYQF